MGFSFSIKCSGKEEPKRKYKVRVKLTKAEEKKALEAALQRKREVKAGLRLDDCDLVGLDECEEGDVVYPKRMSESLLMFDVGFLELQKKESFYSSFVVDYEGELIYLSASHFDFFRKKDVKGPVYLEKKRIKKEKKEMREVFKNDVICGFLDCGLDVKSHWENSVRICGDEIEMSTYDPGVFNIKGKQCKVGERPTILQVEFENYCMDDVIKVGMSIKCLLIAMKKIPMAEDKIKRVVPANVLELLEKEKKK